VELAGPRVDDGEDTLRHPFTFAGMQTALGSLKPVRKALCIAVWFERATQRKIIGNYLSPENTRSAAVNLISDIPGLKGSQREPLMPNPGGPH